MAKRIDFFPWLRAGFVRHGTTLVPDLVQAVWHIIRLRGTMEDLQGSDARSSYVEGLQYKLVDELSTIDSLLSGRPQMNKMHRLALALEHGFTDVARLSGPEVGEQLLELKVTDQHDVCAQLVSWIQDLMAMFPGDLPDIFEPGQAQRRTLRCYRDWSQLCHAAGVDASFMTRFWV